MSSGQPLCKRFLMVVIPVGKTEQQTIDFIRTKVQRVESMNGIELIEFNEPHWLPVLARIRYKVLSLVAKSQQDLAQKYLCVLMSKPLSVHLVRCALLIVVIFLYHGPVLLYPRIGPLLWWALHSGA